MKNSLAALLIFAPCNFLSTPVASAQVFSPAQHAAPAISTESLVAPVEQKIPFYKNIAKGASASFSTWEIPVIAVSVLAARQKPGHGLSLPPFAVDHEISEDWARRDGKKSLGSISPKYYPLMAATSRFAGMVLLDAVGGQDYAPATYTKLFRFQQALYYNTVVTHLAKRNFNRHRPDGSDTQSFFSGHTSTAFATSTFLYLEARDFIDGQTRAHNQRLPLLSPRQWKTLSFGVLYGWAAYVGYSRIRDNRHYLSDVLVGAASGTLVSYLFYPHREDDPTTTKAKLVVLPMTGGAGLGLRVDF